MEVKSLYISGGVNDHCGALAWGSHYLAVAVHHAVGLIETPPLKADSSSKQHGIQRLLCGHSQPITCIRWIRFTLNSEEDLLLSCGNDGRLCVWKPSSKSNEKPLLQLTPPLSDSTTQQTAKSLVYCDGLWLPKQHSVLFVAIESASQRVHVWLVPTNVEDSSSQILLSSDFVYDTFTVNALILSLKLTCLPVDNKVTDESHVLLALGLDTGSISLFYRHFTKSSSDCDAQWIHSLSLQGHENWVRSLDFFDLTQVESSWKAPNSTPEHRAILFLASSSQDNTARVWRFSVNQKNTLEDITRGSIQLQVKEWLLVGVKLKGDDSRQIVVHPETVLSGHESWVHGIAWKPFVPDSVSFTGLELITASWDKSLCVWRPSSSEEYSSSKVSSSGSRSSVYMWTEVSRLGQVGGNSLGLYGAAYSYLDGGLQIAAHGYQGSLFLWTREEIESAEWRSVCISSGHFAAVEGLSWENGEGRYLLTTSQDQTTRLHAPCSQDGVWRELARPQVHGFNMNAIASVCSTGFVSTGDEMVVRAFTAPRSFLDNFHRLTGHVISPVVNGMRDSFATPEGATVPALGLSNKAVYLGEDSAILKKDDKSSQPVSAAGDVMICDDEEGIGGGGGYDPELKHFQPKVYKEPPTEDDLTQNTLWPEVKKLYGHAFEVFSLAAHPQGELVVSACKASQAKHAAIYVWRTADWTLAQRLMFHKLTVVQMQFSHNGQFLLAVSRDRLWSLWSKNTETDGTTNSELFSLHASSDQIRGGHSRIIWGCAWSNDDKYFFTASRDKSIRVWSPGPVSKDQPTCSNVCPPTLLPESVTAIDVSHFIDACDSILVAAGLENGDVHLLQWNDTSFPNGVGWRPLRILSSSNAHHSPIKALRFQPILRKTDSDDKKLYNGSNDSTCIQELILASAGEDKLVRVHHISLTHLV